MQRTTAQERTRRRSWMLAAVFTIVAIVFFATGSAVVAVICVVAVLVNVGVALSARTSGSGPG